MIYILNLSLVTKDISYKHGNKPRTLLVDNNNTDLMQSILIVLYSYLCALRLTEAAISLKKAAEEKDPKDIQCCYVNFLVEMKSFKVYTAHLTENEPDLVLINQYSKIRFSG